MISFSNCSPKSPRFGWGWKNHQEIESGSIRALPDSPFKMLLLEQEEMLHLASCDQDVHYPGAGHYFKLGPVPGRGWSFKAVERQFSPLNASKGFLLNAQSQNSNQAISQSIHLYRQLIAAFSKLMDDSTSPREKEELKTQTVQTTGALAHYIADLHQPFHATHYYTWFLKFPKADLAYKKIKPRLVPGEYNAHRYFEKAIPVRPGRAAPDRIPQALPTESDVVFLLQRQAEDSFRQMFSLVEADREARRNSEPVGYFAQLSKQWQAISEQQMKAAASALATIFQSAYQLATIRNQSAARNNKSVPRQTI